MPRIPGQEVLERVRLRVQRHGWPALYHEVMLRAVNSIVLLKIMRGVWVGRPDPAMSKCPGTYTATFLSEQTLRDFAREPASEMSEEFLDEALAKGDECLAICDGANLAAYGWYSSRPTRIDPPDLLLHFGTDFIYMYKGFTHPRYRGQRLHAIGMTLALQHYLARGFKGLVSYVESSNFDSLKSVFRMGYEQFGSVYVLRIFGRTFVHAGRGCGPFAFRVAQAPAPPV